MKCTTCQSRLYVEESKKTGKCESCRGQKCEFVHANGTVPDDIDYQQG